jgi:hypothetical protein
VEIACDLISCAVSPARSTRNENPRPFSNGSTAAVTSKTGYRTVASAQIARLQKPR